MSLLLLLASAAASPPPTTTVFDSTAVARGGRWSAPFSNSGTMLSQRIGAGGEWRATITGTAADAGVYGDGTGITWTVDGGAPQSASPGGGVQWLNLFTGLPDGPHDVLFKAGTYIDVTNCVRVTGSAPACVPQSGYASPQYRLDASGVATDGSIQLAAEGYDKVGEHGSVRFKATAPTVRVWARSDSGTQVIALVADDDPTPVATATPGTTWGWVTFTGLDGSGQHEYRVIGTRGAYHYAVMPLGTLDTTPLTPLPSAFIYGDSITRGVGLHYYQNWPARWCVLTRRGYQISGNPGEKAYTFGQTHVTDVTGASPAPDLVVLEWGTNDQAASGGSTTGQYRSAMDAMLADVHAAFPSAQVYAQGILDTTSTATNRAAFNTEQSGACTAAGAWAHYVNTDAWTVSTSDGTHPDAAGAAAEAVYYAASIP